MLQTRSFRIEEDEKSFKLVFVNHYVLNFQTLYKKEKKTITLSSKSRKLRLLTHLKHVLGQLWCKIDSVVETYQISTDMGKISIYSLLYTMYLKQFTLRSESDSILTIQSNFRRLHSHIRFWAESVSIFNAPSNFLGLC